MSAENPNERSAVKKVPDTALELTFKDLDQVPEPQTGFADTEISWPEIDHSTLDNPYIISRTPTPSTPEQTTLSGNDPRVPDVVPPTQTAHAIENDPEVVHKVLADSALDTATVEPTAALESAVPASQTTPSVAQKEVSLFTKIKSWF